MGEITYIPDVTHTTKDSAYVIFNTRLEHKVALHNNCICNEYLSLRNRHIVQAGYTVSITWGEVTSKTLKFYYKNSIIPTSYQDVISRYSGNKKKRYVNALNYLQHYGLQDKHAKVSMFIKADRFTEEKVRTKAPRAIQFRSAEYTLEFMRYITAIEHEIYENVHYDVVSKSRVIMKGLNQVERATIFREKASYFSKPKYYCIDHSTFDATIKVEHLRSTHKKYLRMFNSGKFRWLLKQQLNNVGITNSGIKYRIQGTRMSGDADTGLGNSIINADCIYGVLLKSQVVKYDFILDGDDAVIIVEDNDVLDLKWFQEFGFETKVDIVNEEHEVGFCQCKIIADRWVRNPLRAISHYSVAKKLPIQLVRDWVSGMGLCELSIHGGIPILQALGQVMFAQSSKQLLDRDTKMRMGNVSLEDRSCPILDKTREEFFSAYGVDPDLQIKIEELLTSYRKNLLDFNNDESIYRTRQSYELCDECSSCSWWCSS